MGKETEVYFSVDIEAAGKIPGVYSMLSIGAAVVGDTSKNFYAELKPINSNYDQASLDVCGLSMETLAATGKDPEEVMYAFSKWVKETSAGAVPVFVSFGSFDWMFTKWYLERYGYGSLFGVNGIDIKSYAMGMLNTGWAGTTKSRLPADLMPGTKHTHNALDDAKEQAELFYNLLRRNANMHALRNAHKSKNF